MFSGEEPCVKQSSGGGTKNRVIEIECRQKLIDDGNRAANFFRSNYGTAAVLYIDKLRELGVENLLARYKDRFTAILQNADTTEKQAGAMAMMLAADDIASDLFWPDEQKLDVGDISEYLCSAHEVDVTERAYQFVMDTVAVNHVKFSGTDRETWGKINGNTVLINRSVLDKLLAEAGFSFDAVKSKWRDKGYLMIDTQGRLFHVTKCFGVKASYVKLLLLGKAYDDEELPF